MSWSCISIKVGVITDIITTIVALFCAYIAYKSLMQSRDQKSISDDISNKNNLSKLVVFKTRNQTTWFEVNNDNFECHLSDFRKGKKGGLQWKFNKDEINKILSKHDYYIYPGYNIKTGTFSIGQRRNWLYSKNLFPDPISFEIELKKIMEIV